MVKKNNPLKPHLWMLAVLFVISIYSFIIDDYALRFFMNIQNPFLSYVLGVFSNIWFLFFVLLILTTFYLYEKNKKEEIIPLWIAVNMTILVTYYLKFLFERARPIGLIENYFGFVDFSFPSTHVAVAFCVLAIVDYGFKTVKWSWLIVAVLVAVSRMYFYLHYFSDIAFGALLGYALGFALMQLEQRTEGFKSWNRHIWK